MHLMRCTFRVSNVTGLNTGGFIWFGGKNQNGSLSIFILLRKQNKYEQTNKTSAKKTAELDACLD